MNKLDRNIQEHIDRYVNHVINEISINAKKRNERGIRNVLMNKKRFSNIKCFAVFTAQNSDSQQQSGSHNKKANRTLLQALKRANYVVIPTEGKFGNLENSYCVLNISLDTVKQFCGQFQQTSFIYSIVKDGIVHNQYFEKEDVTQPYNHHDNDYIFKDESSDCLDLANADDYYTKCGRFKFNIPFSIFEAVDGKISKNLQSIMLHEGAGRSGNALLNWSFQSCGQTPWRYRKSLYRGLI